MERRKAWLDRSLSLVTDVRPGEGTGALPLAANVLALLAFCYIVKTVRESLVNLVFVAIWLLLVIAIAAEHRKITEVEAAQQAA